MPDLLQRFRGYFSLDQDVNKVDLDGTIEGIVSPLTPELTLETNDEELLKLKKTWTKKWDDHNQKLEKRRKDCENYWKGEHDSDFITQISGLKSEHPLVDNIIFESVETFLPEATRKRAEPTVSTDNTEEGELLADKVRKMLIYLADHLVFKLKLKSVTRDWALYFLGCAKVTWNYEEDEIDINVIKPRNMIFDPNAPIGEKGNYKGEYLGEIKFDSASNLIDRFPDKKKYISEMVQGKLGTQLKYIEWWADYGKMLFWSLKDEILSKVKNPNWNYQETRIKTDEFGREIEESFTPLNHFAQPQYPYVFLSVFNIGKHPHDETSLVEQNLGNQDLITKRYRQIDDNVDGMNGGWAISGELSGLTKEQSNEAIRAFRQGRGVWIPQGNVNNAVVRMQGTSLPSDVFNNLQDARNELRGIFGTAGSTPQGTSQEQTVRGKIIRSQQDQSRIGGGVTEYIEQFADRVFNLMVQMMYVYYNETHIGSIIGEANANELVELRSADMDRKLLVSVKEGSMIPKDPLTIANQAIDLFSAGAIDPIELHTRLDDPNPRETVKKLVEYQADPLSVVGGQQQVQGMSPPLLQGAPEQRSSDIINSLPI